MHSGAIMKFWKKKHLKSIYVYYATKFLVKIYLFIYLFI